MIKCDYKGDGMDYREIIVDGKKIKVAINVDKNSIENNDDLREKYQLDNTIQIKIIDKPFDGEDNE